MKVEIKETFELTPEIAYAAGFIIGDGNLSDSYRIRAVEENKDFMNLFVQNFGKAFGKTPKVYFDTYNNSFVAYVYSKIIWEFFVNELEIPKGNKSSKVRIPTKIVSAEEAVKSAFLSGIFDAEGCVTKVKDSHHPNGYVKIQFKVHNAELAKEVFEMLASLDVKSKLYNYNGFSLVYVLGKTQCRAFMSKVDFRHPIKRDKLRHFL